MTALPKIPVRMTVAEFLAWNPPSTQLRQLLDGEPQAMAPANRTHGAIQNELGSLFRNHLAERSSPCSVVTAPGAIPRVQSETNLRIPDLAVTCSGYDSEESALADPGPADRDPLPEQSGRDLGQCLGLHDHPQRSRDPCAKDGLDRRRASPPQPGRFLAEPTFVHRNRRLDAREHRFPHASRRRLSNDAAGGEQIAKSPVTGFPRLDTAPRSVIVRRPSLATIARAVTPSARCVCQRAKETDFIRVQYPCADHRNAV